MKYLTDNTISLRTVEPDDIDFIYRVESDSTQWILNSVMAPLSRHNIEEYVLNYQANPFADGQLRLIAVSNETGQSIGIADLYEISAHNGTAWIAIYVLPEYRNKGFGHRCVDLLVRYSIDILNLNTLGARISASNVGSIKLFEVAGFRLAGRLSRWLLSGSSTTDLLLYQLHPHL